MPSCKREATSPTTPGSLCEYHLSGTTCEDPNVSDATSRDNAGETIPPTPVTGENGEKESWSDAEFVNPDRSVWPPELLERKQWMGHREKQPFAPWADRNAPVPCSKDGHTTADECDCDARWKWGYDGNYIDGKRVAIAEDDSRLDGRAFLQQYDDPYAYVDGDDVRDSETGAVHPAFIAVLERLGVTYADISTSGAGVHAQYRGELPEGVKEAKWQLDDEPWGANDELPSIEIYAGKRVCVATGDHVPGTPTEIREWDEDALDDLLEEHNQYPTRKSKLSGVRDDYDLDDYEPDATESDDTTDDIRDIFAALDRIDARHVADKTIVHRWNDQASTSDGKRAFAPTWGRNANGTANVVDSEIWQDTGDRGGYGGPVVMALVDLGELNDRGVSPRDAKGKLWWKGVNHLRELGFSIPEYRQSSEDNDPTDADVTLDPEVAWRTASNVTPDDLEADLGFKTIPDAWICPVTGEPVDVVRAVALADGLIMRGDETLRNREYDEAYRRARVEYDAPLPEYLTAETATDQWAHIQGALKQFTHRHLSTIASTVTGLTDDDEEVIAELNPCWADSASEKRILVLDSGAFYCREHERTIAPLRFIALEAGLIDNCEADLAGEAFKEAYHVAREEYGAPLPEWTIGEPDHIPVLPPEEDLLGEFTADIDSLADARQEVEALYRDLADGGGTHVLNALPALGKTTSTVKNADEYPALYLAPRKELQAEVADKAAKFGVTVMHLPVFAENHINKEAKQQALAIVRDEGKDVLKDREALTNRLDSPIFTDDENDADEVELTRTSSPVANGEYGAPWALVYQVASELGYSPRDIITRSEMLFGEEPPVDSDPYSDEWERVTDPETPVDLLIGGYGHGHIGGARTYYHTENDRTKLTPRTVTIDEFPGIDAYGQEYGERYLDHATWLARCLRNDVNDKQGLFEADLWGDDWVHTWLQGDGDDHTAVADATTALKTMETTLGVLDIVTDLQTEHADAIRSLGVQTALTDVVDCHSEWDSDAIGDAYRTLSDVVYDAVPDTGPESVVIERLKDDVLPELVDILRTVDDYDDHLTGLAVPDVVSADLEDLCEGAVDAFRRRGDGAEGVVAAAQTALQGGEDGCRALAVHARDGYAHPFAHLLLHGQIADGEDVATVATEAYTFGDENTNLKRVRLGRNTVLIDRNHHGAYLHHPPEFAANNGVGNPVIGLDATANERLWTLALGRQVNIADIHETGEERRRFLRDVMNLKVVQTSRDMQSYSGPTHNKNFDGDIALVEEVADEYAQKTATVNREFRNGHQRTLRGNYMDVHRTTAPGIITTKKVRQEIEDRLEDTADVIDHYGNVTGSNALGECNLGVVLGSRHYGDEPIEKWAALAGEEVTRTGHGGDLNYGSPVANALLDHMREDETMQAILRFGRDEGGAIVFAHTAALRDDLPVVGVGATVQAYSQNAQDIARAAKKYRRQRFTVGDLADDVDCHRRTIRRVLSEFADLGYLKRDEIKAGVANEYQLRDDPGFGEADLPNVEVAAGTPDKTVIGQYYTWAVRVGGDESLRPRTKWDNSVILPAPDATTVNPPGD